MMNIYQTSLGVESLDPSLKILVVEDNLVQQKLTLRLLEKLNYKPDCLDDTSEVLDVLLHQKYDVLLLDFILIELGNLEWIKHNNQEVFIKTLPQIIVITSEPLEEVKKFLKDFPVSFFLEKPLRLEELRVILSQCQKLSTSSQSTEAIDHEALDRLTQMVGQEATASIIESYIEDAPNIFERLQKGLSDQDISTIYKAAHSLKSSSATVGALILSQVCKDLESKGRKLEKLGVNEIPYESEISPLVQKIYSEYERVKEVFDSLLMDSTFTD